MKWYIKAAVVFCAAVIGLIFYGYHRGKAPMVSVVMLTYQRADMLPYAIESILGQTYRDFELIIINDGSTDNTDDVVTRYEDKRIRYYKNDGNKGIAYSRKLGQEIAAGKYVMIMDDDDVSLLERMEKQVSFLENNPDIDVVAGQIKGFSKVPLTHDEIATELILHNNLGNANVMYRRLFVQDHHISYDEKLQASEDWDFWLQMLFSGAKFAAIEYDVLVRNILSEKHYQGSFAEANAPIRDKVGAFFANGNPEAFYAADSCAKLKMIGHKTVFSKAYLERLFRVNQCF